MSPDPQLWKHDASPTARRVHGFRPPALRRWGSGAVMVVLVGIGIGWWWTARVPARSGPAEQAMSRLKDLRAATQAGLTLDQYRSRLLEAQVATNRYLETTAWAYERDFRVELGRASTLYGAVPEIWLVNIRGVARIEAYADVAHHAVIAACPALATHVAGTESRAGDLAPEIRRGIGVTSGIPLIWACAGEHLDAADQAWPAAP